MKKLVAGLMFFISCLFFWGCDTDNTKKDLPQIIKSLEAPQNNKDLIIARTCLEKAYKGGSSAETPLLAECYQFGLGGDMDLNLAQEVLKSCINNVPEAKFIYAIKYCQNNPEEYKNYMSEAFDMGYYPACFYVSSLLTEASKSKLRSAWMQNYPFNDAQIRMLIKHGIVELNDKKIPEQIRLKLKLETTTDLNEQYEVLLSLVKMGQYDFFGRLYEIAEQLNKTSDIVPLWKPPFLKGWQDRDYQIFKQLKKYK